MTETQTKVLEAQHLLLNGNPGKAEQLMCALLCAEPDNFEAQYALAVAQRHQHKWELALSTLSRILDLKPQLGRAHQEFGYNQLAKQDYMRARAAFERATNSDLP